MGRSLADAQRVHLIGIAGAGMAALATLLLRMGKTVTGSDVSDGPASRALRALGATVYAGHAAEHLGDAEYAIRSAAVPGENPEVAEARRRGLPSVKLAEAVGELMRDRQGVAVAGTHGKSTTTALVTWLLERGGLDPTALIGAESVNFGTSALLGDGPMVVEADEYDRRFLTLSPAVAVVTSVEPDHLDYFKDFEDIRQTFQAFVDKLPAEGRLVACADDQGAAALATQADRQTYGFSTEADWRISDYRPAEGGGSRFTLHHDGRSWEAESGLVGEHNARNAAAAVAVVDYLGVGLQSALASLRTFRGTRRRFETKGRPRGIWVVDDYGHHPTAVAATLQAARDALPRGAIWLVFQPHTTSRTAALLDEFSEAFGTADHVLILPIYRPSGRETSGQSVTSADLVKRIRATGHADARLVETFDDALHEIKRGAVAGDLVLTMGAGDVTQLSDRLVERLGGER